MKKQLAKWFIALAQRLDSQVEQKDGYIARKVGIGIHITKSDVKKFRQLNPQYTSHRKGLEALIEDTKKKSIMNIVAGLVQNGAVDFEVNSTFWTADVKTTLGVYVRQKEAGEE